jgi:tetratricopeptide (TPR) repeat protein
MSGGLRCASAATVILVSIVLHIPMAAAAPPEWWRFLPRAEQNNLWYAQKQDSSCVVVFIHGIFSSSRSCWLYETPDKDPAKATYWPQLVVQDPALARPSIYLAGFYTGLESGRYDMVQAAQELVEALKTDRVLERRSQIIFVGHSTGGIMARYLVTHHSELFVGKEIGLLLMASPSMGSKLANLGHIPSRFLDQQLGQQLEWNSPFLVQLDRDFRALLHDKKTLAIEGREVIENRFVVDSTLLPARTVVVEEASGSRYFGPARMIGGSDHHSIVKPRSVEDPIHKVLVGFYLEHFSPQRERTIPALEAQLRVADREIEQNPKDAFAYRKRGEAYTELGQLQNALQAYDVALSLYPQDFAALQGRAIVLAKRKQFARAIADINAAQQILPDHPSPYMLRAMFRQDAADLEQDPSAREAQHEAALQDLSSAVRMQPKVATLAAQLRPRSLKVLGRSE